MLVLLPPSESKAPAARLDGPALDLGRLSLPALTSARRAAIDALLEASAQPEATRILRVPAGVADEVGANLDLRRAPTGPAAAVYRGVLYDAAGLGDLAVASEEDESAERARTRLARDVVVFSALYGAVGALDPIAPYRMNMSARPPLPGGVTPAAFWRAPLREALDSRAAGDVVVDARSGAYRAAWTPPSDAEVLSVRVEREVDGRRSVVSHAAKHLRGVLTGHLLRRDDATPESAEAVLAAARDMIGRQVGTPTSPAVLVAAELIPAGARGSDELTLVTRPA